LQETERFGGQQIPFDLRLQSRYVSLLPRSSPVPVYGELQVEQLRISENPVNPLNPGTPKEVNLGDGDWRRMHFATVSPWVTDHIIQVNQFLDGETRYIDHSGLASSTVTTGGQPTTWAPGSNSQIESWRTGLEFRLPIDGKGELPEFLQPKPCDEKDSAAAAAASGAGGGVIKQANSVGTPPVPAPLTGQIIAANGLPQTTSATCQPGSDSALRQYVHHIMDWRLRLSTRPSVVRTGPYAHVDPDGSNDPLARGETYFSGDKGVTPGQEQIDNAIPDEDRMHEHRRITLSTDQQWKLFTKGWQRVEGDIPAAKVTNESARDRARRELYYSLERPVTGADEAYDESTQHWLIDRYRLAETDGETPVTLHGDVAYDFLDAEERQREEKFGLPAGATNLPEAWKPINFSLGLSYFGWSLNGAVAYDSYVHAAATESLALTFPTLFETSLVTIYQVNKAFQADESYTRTTMKSAQLSTTLVHPITSFFRILRQVADGQPSDYTNTYNTAYGFKYLSTTDCWGLEFSREKRLAVLETDASYVLRFSMVFMGQERPLPDMSQGALNDTKRNQQL